MCRKCFRMLKEGEDHALFGELEDLDKFYPTLGFRGGKIEDVALNMTNLAKKEQWSPNAFINNVCRQLTDVAGVKFENNDECDKVICNAAANWIVSEEEDKYWKERWTK